MSNGLHCIAAQAASRLNLALGRDSVWRGRCPCCGYGKPTVQIKVQDHGIGVSCLACGQGDKIAAIAGIALNLLVAPEPKSSKAARALKLWDKAQPAASTPVESYLRGRSISLPVPSSIRYLPRQRNWNDGQVYLAMIGLVQQMPSEGEASDEQLVASGVHLTFLETDGTGVRKAVTESNKLSLGHLRSGGVWLTSAADINADLAVAEGIETALSVMQITRLPTVATLSAAGMRSFSWPRQIRRLWIAADNDEVGRQAARALLSRALQSGLQAHIKVPSRGKNDFNDFIRGDI